MYKKLSRCRICGGMDLALVLDLGEQVLTGVFPSTVDQQITKGPVQLVKCTGSCGLLQMAHSYDLNEMYGDNYGYRSGLNQSMVRHLNNKVERIRGLVDLSGSPVVLDIGSNDGTTLRAYPENCVRIGIDPTADKFREYYPDNVTVVSDFFSADRFRQALPGRQARVVTSFSMFYDLESPMDFVKEVASVLEDDGVWVFEQSYMPLMLETNSFDTACHEHLEYYAVKQIQWMMERAGLKIVDVELNDVNGGSFSVTAAKTGSAYPEFSRLQSLLQKEIAEGLDTLTPYQAFATRIDAACDSLKRFVASARAEGKTVAALGASTKGNVLLQYCGFGPDDIVAVAEVNPYKYGRYTPGTLIPIRAEADVLAAKPDYLLVLPWHFRAFFIQKYRGMSSQLLFPLPTLEIV